MVSIYINTFGLWLLVIVMVILFYQNYLLRLDINEIAEKHNNLADIIDEILDNLEEDDESENDEK